MYIFKNAFRCIARAKGRSFIIGIVVVLLSVSSCVGLSIKEANKTLKKQYADDMEISATVNSKSRETAITLDALNELSKKDTVKAFYKTASLYFSAGDKIEPIDVAGSFKQNKDFREKFGDVKPGEQRSYKSSESSGVETQSSKGSAAVTLLVNTGEPNAVPNENPDENEPQQKENLPEDENTESQPTEENKDSETEKDASESDNKKENTPKNDNSSENSGSKSPADSRGDIPQNTPPQMGGGDTFITNNFFFNMASMNDFTVIGSDSKSVLPSYVDELNVLDLVSKDYKCVISKNLADENDLNTGDTFTLKNPENEDEIYTFTIAGIGDSSKSDSGEETSSNASFTDNCIYVNYATVEDIISASSTANGDKTAEDNENKKIALSPSYSGKFIFASLTDYNTFEESISENYTAVSEDVSNYEQSISQLETLGKYATYFLIVIFVIGAFVLVIINLFSIRNRKYEIGVLTAIGMKKYKVALQFITELFVVTFIALIIGSSVGAVSSVPVTNALLKTVNSAEEAEPAMMNRDMENTPGGNGDMTPPDGFGNGSFKEFKGMANNYIASINSATNITVILEMIGVGIILTVISSIASMMFIMRYEPLKILNNRD